MNRIFLGLLVFVPIALIAHYAGASPILVFALSCLAIVPLAKLIGDATESLATHTGPALGGLLNATFGNATELIIAVFALRAGLVEVVKASLTGSILGNLLLVLGTAMIAGGAKYKKQSFNRTGAQANGSTLFVAVIALIVPALLVADSSSLLPARIENLSVIVAAIMVVTYIMMLWFFNHTHKYLYESQPTKNAKRASRKKIPWKEIAMLLGATLAVSWVSEILIGSLEPSIVQLGWTELFVGVIVVAIIGNIAEHVSAITFAVKNNMDLALQVALGSATQIILFVAPVLVLVSVFFQTPMDLLFTSFELFAMILSVVLVNLIVADGESNWLEGVQLLSTYLIFAVAFYLHP